MAKVYIKNKDSYEELVITADGTFIQDATKVGSGNTLVSVSNKGAGKIEFTSADRADPIKVVTTLPAKLKPNVYYKVANPLTGSVTINLDVEIPNIYNEYMLEFSTGSPAPTINWNSSLKWEDGSPLVVKANKKYQISIVNNIALYKEI